LQGGTVARFEELAVWKRSARLSADLYKSLRDLKDFGFRDQITRSGLSVPSNIAEGYERGSAKETVNFLNYAKGSAGELRTQLYIAIDIGYIEREAGMAWIKEAEEISRMLHGLMQTIRTQKT
jgi:four helix bundle protein